MRIVEQRPDEAEVFLGEPVVDTHPQATATVVGLTAEVNDWFTTYWEPKGGGFGD